ncbi:hypothetical protein PY365_14550 [Roseiarcaceae bacterium H3SJ34-1]|uniref:hypothetical protein n=1 Tax=Terripilifer ovatus TaxID=3032367 RepID=UPI003AB993F9|nr:hypothetical protein [Roseiarcaceae bacterium H3SJ34-1]
MTGLLRKGLGASDMPEPLDTDGVNLYALVAREARIAVVFRRGPARRTQVLLWRLDTDTVESGQWFKGRIYERRCDLSADGTLLALFCASFRKPLFSWTAITRPPYVAPLALWPKGDCWGGGGLFDGGVLKLNHGSGAAGDPQESGLKLDPAFRLPAHLSMQPLPMPLGQGLGRGEDDPIRVLRMERDGWQWIGAKPGPHIRQTKSNVYQVFDKPFVARRAIGGHQSGPLFLQLQHHAIAENQGRWYLETAQIVDGENRALFDLGRVDFADLDPNGDVLYGTKGWLCRLPLAQWTRDEQGQSDSAPKPLRVADLNGERFEIVSVPQRAKVWP